VKSNVGGRNACGLLYIYRHLMVAFRSPCHVLCRTAIRINGSFQIQVSYCNAAMLSIGAGTHMTSLSSATNVAGYKYWKCTQTTYLHY